MENFKFKLKNKNFFEKVKLIKRSGNLTENHTTYATILFFMKLIALTEKNVLCVNFGDPDTGKSYISEKFLGAKKFQEFPTPARLRGSSKEGYDAALNESIIVIEEIGDNHANISEGIGLIKEALSSKNFLENNKDSRKTETSFIFNLNDQKKVTHLNDIDFENVFKCLPSSMNEDGLKDRIHLFLGHYKAVLGESKYLVETEYFIEFKEFLKNLRNVDIPIFIKENLSSRESENLLKVKKGFIKILYSNDEVENIPNYVEQGIEEISKYFNYKLNKRGNKLLTLKSARLIAEISGVETTDESKFYILEENRFLQVDKNIARIIAIDESAKKENEHTLLLQKEKPNLFFKFLKDINNCQIIEFEIEDSFININDFNYDDSMFELASLRYKKEKEQHLKKIQVVLIEQFSSFILNSYYNFYPKLNIAEKLKNILCIIQNIIEFDKALNDIKKNSFKNHINFFLIPWINNLLVMNLNQHVSNPFIDFDFTNYFFEKNLIIIFKNIFSTNQDEFSNFILRGLNLIEEVNTPVKYKLNKKNIISDSIKKINKTKIEKALGKKIEKNFMYYAHQTTFNPKLIVAY
nr:BREX system Lon protease-like protein BrxL [Fusobacterium gastrosuis]